MAESITQDERKAALEIANEVTMLADGDVGDFVERVLHAAAHKIRRHYGYSANLKKTEVLRRVTREPLGITVVELKHDSGFHKRDVYDIVKMLESEGKVMLEKVHPAGSKGGRPTLLVKVAMENAEVFAP